MKPTVARARSEPIVLIAVLAAVGDGLGEGLHWRQIVGLALAGLARQLVQPHYKDQTGDTG